MNSDDLLKSFELYIASMFSAELNHMVAQEIVAEITSLAKHKLEVGIANSLRQISKEHFFIIEPEHAYHYIVTPLGQFFLVQSLNREQATALLKQKS